MTRNRLALPLLALCVAATLTSPANAQTLGGRRALNTVTVSQSGAGNTGAVTQAGQANDAALGQAGVNNSGSIAQIGNGNTACLYQHGRNLSGGITQYGDGQSVAYIQTRSGMRPALMSTCMAQANAISPRNIVIPSNIRLLPGR